MKDAIRKLIYLIATTFLIFIIGGFLLASETVRWWLELIWLVSLTLVALGVIGYGGLVAILTIRAKCQKENSFSPDENGNLPVIRVKGQWLNLNLLGADSQSYAWAIWQATNNRSAGSPARELFTSTRLLPSPPQVNLPLIEATGQSEVIDAIAKEIQ